MAFLVDAVTIHGPAASASGGSGTFVSAIATAVLGGKAGARLGRNVSAAFGQAEAATLLVVGVTWLQVRASPRSQQPPVCMPGGAHNP